MRLVKLLLNVFHKEASVPTERITGSDGSIWERSSSNNPWKKVQPDNFNLLGENMNPCCTVVLSPSSARRKHEDKWDLLWKCPTCNTYYRKDSLAEPPVKLKMPDLGAYLDIIDHPIQDGIQIKNIFQGIPIFDDIRNSYAGTPAPRSEYPWMCFNCFFHPTENEDGTHTCRACGTTYRTMEVSAGLKMYYKIEEVEFDQTPIIQDKEYVDQVVEEMSQMAEADIQEEENPSGITEGVEEDFKYEEAIATDGLPLPAEETEKQTLLESVIASEAANQSVLTTEQISNELLKSAIDSEVNEVFETMVASNPSTTDHLNNDLARLGLSAKDLWDASATSDRDLTKSGLSVPEDKRFIKVIITTMIDGNDKNYGHSIEEAIAHTFEDGKLLSISTGQYYRSKYIGNVDSMYCSSRDTNNTDDQMIFGQIIRIALKDRSRAPYSIFVELDDSRSVSIE